MSDQPSSSPPMCVDPARCEHCPPSKVCAWACEQGWSMNDILIEARLIEEGKLPPHPDPDEETECVRQAMWDSFN